MLTTVDAQFRIQWETFTIQDEFAVTFRYPVVAARVSEEMSDIMLAELSWSGVRKIDPDTGKFMIGYGIGDPDDVQGYTEAEAYSEWIGDLRNKQKNLVTQLPLIRASQTAFDALFSLFVDTGNWRIVEAEEGVYDLASAVKDGDWLLVADIISRGKNNPILRKKEARVIQLGDYSLNKDRRQQAAQGVQLLRTRYFAGINNEVDRKQTEFVYYRQLGGAFLPGMSQLRQRRVVAQART